ncbi:MAG: hypothetical protein M1822_006381 [Bathelium mastoideum]|nr:MAG: hypothetical protein M1822_006381 [Bathelium mastoideum]
MSKGKVCLAYSGGLDTSTILRWLLDEGYEVVCFLADVGQEEDWDQVRAKAKQIGATKMVIQDLKREFVEELCFRAIQCNAQYEACSVCHCDVSRFLWVSNLTASSGTSLARPVIARSQMKVAKEEGCDFVSHGCTGKGNDQIIAPWRIPAFFNRFQGRNDLLDYAATKNIPVTSTKAKPFSPHVEAGILEDPSLPPPEDMWTLTIDPQAATDKPVDIVINFEKGLPVKLQASDRVYTDSLELFGALNAIGKAAGIGRIDIVENRFIGLKSRGCYDAPAMTILRLAHLDAEGLVLDGAVRSLRDQFVTHNWSELLYKGLYFSPEREFIENSLVFAQRRVNAEVRLRCYKGSVWVLGRSSETEKLYDAEEASMDSLEDFSPVDTTGFININAIRLKKYGLQKAEQGKSLTEL